jgi:low temperature requirement protein LtrA
VTEETGEVEQTPGSLRVSTWELFFDLVFVFTITSLAALLSARVSWLTAGRVALLFGIIFWMYGGYAWLTNAVPPNTTTRRTLLGLGMGGFLVIGMSIPDAFGSSGWAFGLGYFIVNAVHSGLYLSVAGRGALVAMRRLGPLNLLSATIILCGGLAAPQWRGPAWCVGMVVIVVAPYLLRIGGFQLHPTHFVERHGLVVLIALGESIVAIGAGATGVRLSGGLLLFALLALVLSYYLWWAYFGGDDRMAERALSAVTDPTRRGRLAVIAYGYAHYPLLLGIVAMAAGLKKAIGHPFSALPLAPGLALSGGVALFLISEVAFRQVLGIGRSVFRVAAAVLALATAPLGLAIGAAGQLGVLVLAVAVPIIVGDLTAMKTGTFTPYLSAE